MKKQHILKDSIEKLQLEKLEITKKLKHSEKENSILLKNETEMSKRFEDLIELNKLIQKDLQDHQNETSKLEAEKSKIESKIAKFELSINGHQERLEKQTKILMTRNIFKLI